MTELPKKLDKMFLKLERTALLVEQRLAETLAALAEDNLDEAKNIIAADEEINRAEVEIERECIRLLALYQPAAGDLRRICFAIKVNNDLERMADNCVSMAKMLPALMKDDISVKAFPAFQPFADSVVDALHQTVRLVISDRNEPLALAVFHNDHLVVDKLFSNFQQSVINDKTLLTDKANGRYALTSIGRALERIGDLCTNVAEDTVFLLTGEIVRHSIKE